jgi:D-sedoheptulose 7-phosphate isomerase
LDPAALDLHLVAHFASFGCDGQDDGMTEAERLSPRALAVVEELVIRCPELSACRGSLAAAGALVVTCFRRDGRLYLCGNGGSHADSLHIAGELVKSYMAARPLSAARRAALTGGGGGAGGADDARAGLRDGGMLADLLQAGLPAVALGANGAVVSAISNDLGAELCFAQELEALGRPGDVLFALSTSGASVNVVLAAQVARSLQMDVVALVGGAGASSPLSGLADVVVAAPASSVNEVQEQHSRMYHALCGVIEAELF